MGKKFCDATSLGFALWVQAGDRVAHLDASRSNSTNRDAANEVGVIQIRYE
jgi:hypothetical protein